MSHHPNPLPHQDDRLYLTDGGMETTLIFHEGFDLPYFAAFELLKTRQGRQALRSYYERYAALAVNAHTGFILESPTWRANPDWGRKLGYDAQQLATANTAAINMLQEIREEFRAPGSPFIISGCIGPRGDGYVVGETMGTEQARSYHSYQIRTFAAAGADMVAALTMTYPDEAIGIVQAAQDADIPVVISFTTETDGRLPNGDTLQQAIEAVDAATDNGPIYYMINCAHPDHFSQALAESAPWVKRIRGIRANASRRSHAELDEATELDDGNPSELGEQYQSLRRQFPQFQVLGGCCGTDHRHVGEICHHCSEPHPTRKLA